jgi:hypothetical protein
MTERYRAGKRLWSESDDARLRREYPDTPTAVLARELKRSLAATYNRAKSLGLTKSAAYLESPAACRLRRGDHVGAGTRYGKGHVPANQGLRRPGWFAGRMKVSQFKKGSRPHTWVPIGTEVFDRDGYHKRKVSDDRTRPSRFNWKFVHALVWEQAHGPVPVNHAVAFKNGDKSDTRIENLELITRSALMKRNTVHNLPLPLKQTIHLLGQLTRRIREKSENDHGLEKQNHRPA